MGSGRAWSKIEKIETSWLMAAPKREIPEKLTVRLGRRSFLPLEHVILIWIEGSKPQIYHF